MIAHVPLRVTDDELTRVSLANPGWTVERDADGTVHMSPPNGGKSSRRNFRLLIWLEEWAQAHGFVGFDSSGGFKFPDTSVLSPDAAFIRAADWNRLSPDEQEGFVRVPPVVAVELVSQSDRPDDLRKKLLRMRGYGVEHVVLIDPYRRDVWSDGEPPPGFPIDFTPFFDED
jgi:Uma2 family endonuclease